MMRLFTKPSKAKTIIKYIFIGGLFISVASIGIVEYYTSNQIREHKLSELDFKLWSHAGYVKDSLDGVKNSIQSFDKAQSLGAKGLEVDVIYDVSLKKFVVSHDFPYSRYDNKLLFLDSVFSKYQNNFVYWLDYKNLKDLKKEDVAESYERLEFIVQAQKLQKENVLIESVNVDNLSYFTDKGYYTSWWINPYKSKYKSILRNFKYRLYYTLGRYSSLSMRYTYYERVEEKLNNIPINLWTINDGDYYNSVKDNDRVKIILTDNNWFTSKE